MEVTMGCHDGAVDTVVKLGSKTSASLGRTEPKSLRHFWIVMRNLRTVLRNGEHW